MKKKKRYQNEKYIEFIKQQPCCISGKLNVDPHHTKSKGSGGSDLMCIPLSHELHVECHTIGKKTFQAKYNINFEVIVFDLLQKFIEREY